MTIEQLGIGISGAGNPGPTTGGSQEKFGNGNTQIAYSKIASEIVSDERAHVSLIRSALIGVGAMPVAKPAINLGALGLGFGGIADFLQLARVFRIAQTEAEHSANIRLQMAIRDRNTFRSTAMP